ncbi:MAG: hypothetical protein Ct9H90mP25_3400 [Gammaproteobacteria bacterium]|nr:MAG: hypothetical protein Ct9H90mP25_3400 [Gammaproteobacteria bacterium]
MSRILSNIRNARNLGDFVIPRRTYPPKPVYSRNPTSKHTATRVLFDLAHQAIDAGADAFVGKPGGQTLRGIEIYKGKPIFYGLGEFFREAQWELELMMGNADWNPDRRMQRFARNFGGKTQSLESLVAISHYKGWSIDRGAVISYRVR